MMTNDEMLAAAREAWASDEPALVYAAKADFARGDLVAAVASFLGAETEDDLAACEDLVDECPAEAATLPEVD